MDNPLIDTWNIHNRINLYLLEAISPEALKSLPVGARTRDVARMFAHMHQIRLTWLETAAPELLEGLEKIGAKQVVDQKLLHQSLERSGQSIAALFQKGIEAGKIKGFKPHPAAFLGYLISHEAYHRGEICMALSQAGHPLDDKVMYGQWEWGRR